MTTIPATRNARIIREIKAVIRKKLLGSVALMPTETEAAYLSYAKSLFENLKPVGAMEEEMAQRIVGTLWRLKRIPRLEALILGELDCEMKVKRISELREYLDKVGMGLYDSPWTFKSNVQEMFRKDFTTAVGNEVEVKMGAREVKPGQGLMHDSTDRTFGLLRRYESRLERSLYAAIAQLERLQYKRAKEAGQPTSQALPLASLDVIAGDTLDDDRD
jgi:hypothetical protein